MKRWEIVCISVIVLIGAFLRLYRLPESLMFRGDQGRDAIIAKNILKEGDVALIGPVTSVGNMYLGPLYYYFMVPFLALTYPDPVGPAFGVALVNILTIYLIYWVGKKTIGSRAGMLAALIFALMPSAIIYGRFSWNPNIAPFFSILIFFVLNRWWQSRSLWDFVGASVLIGLLTQTHYVSLTVVGVIGMMWLIKLIWDKKIGLSVKELVLGLSGFGATFIPLVVFDFRHGHIISQQFLNFFTSPEKHLRTWDISKQISFLMDKAEYILARLLLLPVENTTTDYLLFAGLLLAVVYAIINRKSIKIGVGIIWIWLATAIIGTSFYSHTTYIHYLTFSLPIISLFWGKIVDFFWKRRFYWGGLGVAGVIIWMEILGLTKVGWGGLGTATLAESVRRAIPDVVEPYNLALLSDDKDYKGMSYRYFFEVTGKKPLPPEDYSNLNTLVLIDETFLDDPRQVPIYEIEAAEDFNLEKRIEIPQGPWIYIYKKG